MRDMLYGTLLLMISFDFGRSIHFLKTQQSSYLAANKNTILTTIRLVEGPRPIFRENDALIFQLLKKNKEGVLEKTGDLFLGLITNVSPRHWDELTEKIKDRLSCFYSQEDINRPTTSLIQIEFKLKSGIFGFQ